MPRPLSPHARPAHRLGALATFGLAAVFALAPADPGGAAPAAGAGAPDRSAKPQARKRPFASPLVTFEHIDAGVLAGGGHGGHGGPGGPGGLGGPGAWHRDGVEPPPIFLLDPDGFTTFGQVVPPDSGHLIMLVE